MIIQTSFKTFCQNYKKFLFSIINLQGNEKSETNNYLVHSNIKMLRKH